MRRRGGCCPGEGFGLTRADTAGAGVAQLDVAPADSAR